MKHLRIPFVMLAAVGFAFAGTGVAWADVIAGPSAVAVVGAVGIGALVVIGLVIAGIVLASILILRRIRGSRRADEPQDTPSEDRRAS